MFVYGRRVARRSFPYPLWMGSQFNSIRLYGTTLNLRFSLPWVMTPASRVGPSGGLIPQRLPLRTQTD